ncbi:MAG: hypothetical protein JHC41_01925 [Nitrosopumilus sp.]|nr:hypothetical protein [Nitrosopumilus sp.]
MNSFIVRCRACKSKIIIPDQGPCTDLEYMEYINGYKIKCKCKEDVGVTFLIQSCNTEI